MSDARFDETPKRRANGAALATELAEIFGGRDVEDWRNRLKEHGIAFSILNRARDLPHDAQVLASGAIAETAIPEMPQTIAAPFALADTPVPPATPAPGLGEHSDAVLREAGVDAEVIARLRRDGAIV